MMCRVCRLQTSSSLVAKHFWPKTKPSSTSGSPGVSHMPLGEFQVRFQQKSLLFSQRASPGEEPGQQLLSVQSDPSEPLKCWPPSGSHSDFFFPAVRTAALGRFKHPPPFGGGSNWALWDVWWGGNFVASPDFDFSIISLSCWELSLSSFCSRNTNEPESGAPDAGDFRQQSPETSSCTQVIATSSIPVLPSTSWISVDWAQPL